MDSSEHQQLRQLLDDYLRMYSSRDDRLTTHFSDDFSGLTGGGDFLVKAREEWVAITRQDFAQIKEPIRIELKDLSIQSLAESVAVATSLFTIHLPIKDHVLSRKTARLVLIFRKEPAGWKISHSSISVPFGEVREGEVYPLKELTDRNQFLEELIAERTTQLSQANGRLQQANEGLATEIVAHERAEEALEKERRRLQQVLDEVRTLRGILPICAHCKKIRDDHGFWSQVEKYVSEHTEARFSHGICPDCMEELYPGEDDKEEPGA
ncbi:MAG TPA: nuclear transport factor 2 family protein [Anaeromyxobacteraceae bacterium]